MQGLSYLITYREAGSSDRRGNLLAVVRWLAQWPKVQVLVIEQDTVPRLDREPPFPKSSAWLAYNPGPFNKGWGFNVAARVARGPVLALADADVIAPHALAEAVERCQQGQGAIKPYRTIVDLTSDETARVRSGEWDFAPARPPGAPRNREGQSEHVMFAGGLFVIQRETYLRLGGFDERFLGWGGEDDAMAQKLKRAGVTLTEIGAYPALHLWHPRSPESTFGQPHYEANRRLLTDYATYGDAAFAQLCEVQRQTMGNLHKYRPAS
jgi:glycosyl transferase family 7 (putative galactosyltransferase)